MTSVAAQRRRRRLTQPDALDVPLEDTELLEEMRLTTEFFIAASQSRSHLAQVQIERILGLN